MKTMQAFKRGVAAVLLAAAGAVPIQVQAQAPGIVGVDHVGINVPDLEQGVAFFREMFGFQPVTKLGPFKLDAQWKRRYRLHDDTREATLVMLRAGDGANIELFAYSPSSAAKRQPWRDDIGASHISLYTTDIAATKAYLEAKGVRFLGNVNAGAGDTEGESWVYLETPWGATIELNSYPNGKAYEKRGPATQLWTAAASVSLAAAAPTDAALQALAAGHIAIWNEDDAQARQARIGGVYSDKVLFVDPEQPVQGLGALNGRITALRAAHPGFRFTLGGIDSSRNMARLRWHYGPASDPQRISGTDVIVVEDGKVRSLNVFLEH